MSETAPVTPSTLGLNPTSEEITLGRSNPPPGPAPHIEASAQSVEADKAFSRLLNYVAGQFSIRMAQADRTRDDVAAQSKLPVDLLRRIQAGEASDLTLFQFNSLAQTLGGSPAVSIQFPHPPAQSPKLE